jgi:hypothetical protein
MSQVEHIEFVQDEEAAASAAVAPAFAPGTRVEVRRRFDQAWARGFVVHDAAEGGYRLRRTSDGAVLPVAFPDSELRVAPDS